MKKKTYKIPQNLKWSFTTLAGYVLVIVNYKFEGSPLRRGNEIGMYFNVVCIWNRYYQCDKHMRYYEGQPNNTKTFALAYLLHVI